MRIKRQAYLECCCAQIKGKTAALARSESHWNLIINLRKLRICVIETVASLERTMRDNVEHLFTRDYCRSRATAMRMRTRLMLSQLRALAKMSCAS